MALYCAEDLFAKKAAVYMEVVDSPGGRVDPGANLPEPDDLHK